MLTSIQGNIAKLAIATLLTLTVAGVPTRTQAQSPGDIVVIGDSPLQWERFRSYWNRLLDLNAPASSQQSFNQPQSSPQALQEELIRNIQVSNLQLQPIIRLNGSSLLIGTLTNGNPTPVTVASVNFEILDSRGNMVQTGAATPQPATIPPGQSVTFQTTLATIPPDGGFQVRLANPPLLLQGGV